MKKNHKISSDLFHVFCDAIWGACYLVAYIISIPTRILLFVVTKK